MKNLIGFAMVLLMFSVTAVFAAEFAQPQLPAAENFKFAGNYGCKTAIISVFSYRGPDGNWEKWHLDGNDKPFAVSRTNSDSSDVYWVDRGSDGFFEEHYSSFEAISVVYPTPCDVLAVK